MFAIEAGRVLYMYTNSKFVGMGANKLNPNTEINLKIKIKQVSIQRNEAGGSMNYN